MPSFSTKHSDAPALRRVRELFRKKQDVKGDAASVRELLQSDRAGLLRDIERILEGHKSLENLVPLKEARTAVTYCSTASQTEPEEEPQLASAESEDTAAAVDICTYMSSSTQTDLPVVEETTGPSKMAKLPAPSRPLLAGSPASTVSRLPPCNGVGLDKATKAAEGEDTPKAALLPASIGQTTSSRSLASQHVADNPLDRSTKGAVTRHQRHKVDDKTGTILVWNYSKVRWKEGKILTACLPPQRFAGPAISNTSKKHHPPPTFTEHKVYGAPEKPQQLPTTSKTVARDIYEMRQILQALQSGGEWVAVDDEDEGADGDDEDVDNKDRATKRLKKNMTRVMPLNSDGLY